MSADFDSAEFYDRMSRWSESAAAAGDAETMLIAEIAQGHTVDLDRYALDARAMLCLRGILSAHSPRLAACRIADAFVDPDSVTDDLCPHCQDLECDSPGDACWAAPIPTQQEIEDAREQYENEKWAHLHRLGFVRAEEP